MLKNGLEEVLVRVIELIAKGTVGGGLLLQNGPLVIRRSLLSTL
jgi:hypothetical protein